MKDTQQSPIISVIMCVYNGEQTVMPAAMSILRQSFQNLELLICDDASTDGTWARLEELLAADGRVKQAESRRGRIAQPLFRLREGRLYCPDGRG